MWAALHCVHSNNLLKVFDKKTDIVILNFIFSQKKFLITNNITRSYETNAFALAIEFN